MSVAILRARLREKSGALAPLKVKAFAEVASVEDRTALKTAMDDIVGVEEQLELAERDEALQAKASRRADATTQTVEDIKSTALAATAKTYKQEDVLAIAAAAVVKAGTTGNALKILEDDGYGGLVKELQINTKAVNTLVSSEGGILVPAAIMGGIMPLLRARSTFIDAGPVRVRLTNGKYTLPRGLAGSTASYIAEGALKPVSTPTWDGVSMQAKKLAGIVPMTNEARDWAIGDLVAYVREDLRNALALTMDLNAWLGTGAGAAPTGILNKTGVQTFTGTFAGPTAPTLAELDALATGMILKLTTANIFANGNWRWIMSYRTAMRLADTRDGNGNKAFPMMEGVGTAAANWKGFPVTVTSQIPTNGGVGTDETTLALVDFSHVLFGEEEGVRMAMSDHATLNTTGATNGTGLVHLWQQNMFAILAESMHDFGLRTALAVVKSTIRF